MKKFFVTTMIAVSLISSAFASEDKGVSYAIKSTFSENFGQVKNVQWSVTEEYAKASFQKNKEKVDAFYQLNGAFIGTSKAIELEELPIYAKRALAKKYADYTITEAIEFTKPTEEAYFISIVKNGASKILMISNGAVSVYKG